MILVPVPGRCLSASKPRASGDDPQDGYRALTGAL